MNKKLALMGVGVLSVLGVAACGGSSSPNAAVKNFCNKSLVLSNDLNVNNLGSLSGAQGNADGKAFGLAAVEAGPKYLSEARIVASDLVAENLPAAQAELNQITNAC